ncbi:MAG TPA: hypothetical protein VMW87_14130 [Spirochaetia bacterium]|nr:hypothetical protein [Spirochaetia bacterium]
MRYGSRGKRLYALAALALIIPFALFRLSGTPGRAREPDQLAPVAHFTATEAVRHFGTYAVVTGIVAEVHEGADTRATANDPTFLDFGSPYPAQSLTAVVFSRDRSRFPNLASLVGRTVQVTGRIERYKGRAEIILSSPGQLRIVN